MSHDINDTWSRRMEVTNCSKMCTWHRSAHKLNIPYFPVDPTVEVAVMWLHHTRIWTHFRIFCVTRCNLSRSLKQHFIFRANAFEMLPAPLLSRVGADFYVPNSTGIKISRVGSVNQYNWCYTFPASKHHLYDRKCPFYASCVWSIGNMCYDAC